MRTSYAVAMILQLLIEVFEVGWVVPRTVNDQNGGFGLSHGGRVGRWEGAKVEISECTSGERGGLISETLHDDPKRVKI